MTRTGIICAAALMAGTAWAQEGPDATASFVDAEGNGNGKAELTQTPTGVLLDIEVSRLPAGQWVAFHVHETGSCDHETNHESAGGHYNPTSQEHGFLATEGPHAGDMPNQYVGDDGILRAQVFNPSVGIGEGDSDIAGHALMIHAKADDYRSQPSGDAGDRLACGVIE